MQLKSISVEFWRLFLAWKQPEQENLKTGRDDSVLYSKNTFTVYSAIPIVSRQYGWKIFRSNFDYFSESGNHQRRTSWKPGTHYSVLHLNIATMFGMQFILFAVSIVEKYFSRILTCFPDPETTRAGKVENRTQMIQFCTQTLPPLFGVQFASFLVTTTKKCFSWILMSFPGPDTTGTSLELAKL